MLQYEIHGIQMKTRIKMVREADEKMNTRILKSYTQNESNTHTKISIYINLDKRCSM